MRLRDELWFAAKEWFEARDCKMPDDKALISELVAPRFFIESTGKLRVEAKAETKKRISKSPDLADAFILTFALPSSKSFFKPLNYSNKGFY